MGEPLESPALPFPYLGLSLCSSTFRLLELALSPYFLVFTQGPTGKQHIQCVYRVSLMLSLPSLSLSLHPVPLKPRWGVENCSLGR